MNSLTEKFTIHDKNITSSIQNTNSINSTETKNKNCLDNKALYSPFVIKKPSENFSNLNNLNFNKKLFSPESPCTKINNKIYTPSPNNFLKERLSDRFIPMNKGTNLLEKFELTLTSEHKCHKELVTDEEKNKNNLSYNYLLQNNFFGFNQDFNDPILRSLGKNSNIDLESYNITDSNSNGNIKSKIFKYKTETKKKPSSKINLGETFEKMNSKLNYIRKIPNKPYKIIEAPGLLDDFYLNLLDWSSKNDIAVGLNNSVFLWSSNKTHLLNLFTYEQEKYVSSIIWNQSGTELAVGNSEGIVEIWDGKLNSYFF